MCRTLFQEFNTCLSQQCAQPPRTTVERSLQPGDALRLRRRSTTEEEFERRIAEYQRRKQPEAALPTDVRPSDLLVSGR